MTRLNQIPKPFRARIKGAPTSEFGQEIKAAVEEGLENTDNWKDARLEISNYLQNLIDEARKAQVFYTKE